MNKITKISIIASIALMATSSLSAMDEQSIGKIAKIKSASIKQTTNNTKKIDDGTAFFKKEETKQKVEVSTNNKIKTIKVSGEVKEKEGRVLTTEFILNEGIELPTKLLEYLRATITFPDKVEFVSFKFTDVLSLDGTMDEWQKYFAIITVKDKATKRDIVIPQAFFFNKEMGLATSALINYNTATDYSDTAVMFSENMYKNDKAHLISGGEKSKHKVVIFSDPMCEHCINEVPLMIKEMRAYPDLFAVYEYQYPLAIHPASDIISRIKIASRAFNKMPEEVDKIFYKMKGEIKPNQTNALLIIRRMNKMIGQDTGITVKDLNSKKVMGGIQADIEIGRNLIVSGTPSVYFDGHVDLKRDKFKGIIKENTLEVKEEKASGITTEANKTETVSENKNIDS